MAGFASTVSFLSAAILIEAEGWRVTALAFAAGAALLAALKKPQFWIIGLAFPIMALNHGILLNHIMPLLTEKGVLETTAVLVASTIGPMQVFGRIVMTVLGNRVTTMQVAAFAFGGVVIASLLLLFAGVSPAFAFAFAVFQGGAYGLTSIIKPAITADFLGRTGYGAIAGWLALPYLVGFAFAPHIGSLIWEAGGYDLVVPCTAAFAALGVLCMLGLAASGKPRPPRADPPSV
jgi:predicted MFS family arabinose efflux permease